MTDREFDEKFRMMVRSERRLTNEILHMINKCDESKRYLYLGYSSLFAWLVYGHGYSESAAFRRIEGARMLHAVPETAGKLESGEVSLSNIAKVQTAVRAQEKITKHKVSAAEKREAIAAVTGKSSLQAELSLMQILPEAQSEISRDRTNAIDEDTVRLSFNVSKIVSNDLERAKEVLSHAIPSGANGLILGRLLKEFLNRKDPLKRVMAKEIPTAAQVQ